jgi:hypothetical protein
MLVGGSVSYLVGGSVSCYVGGSVSCSVGGSVSYLVILFVGGSVRCSSVARLDSQYVVQLVTRSLG